ncbi:TPA: glycosyltransferase family 1 protein, partial [Enterococcus faecium]|nr:glycosyltransferase family 1 protein [Enterococcus faecium]
MRIVVNDIAASEGGAMSVLRDLHSDIISSGDENEWIFLLGEKFIEESDNIKVLTFPKIKTSWIKRLDFDFISGKKIINKLQPDIYLSLQNTATIGVKAPQYVFLHQPLPYQKEKNFSFIKKKEFKMATYQHVIGKIYSILFKKTKATIIVQTQWMKENVSSILNNKILKVDTKINIDENIINKQINENKRNMKHFFYPASN